MSTNTYLLRSKHTLRKSERYVDIYIFYFYCFSFVLINVYGRIQVAAKNKAISTAKAPKSSTTKATKSKVKFLRKKMPTKPSKEVKAFILPHDLDESVYSDASEDQHVFYDHPYDHPEHFVVFLTNKGIDIEFFLDKDYLHKMWVEFHGGDNPCGRECDTYGSLCLRSDCTNY